MLQSDRMTTTIIPSLTVAYAVWQGAPDAEYGVRSSNRTRCLKGGDGLFLGTTSGTNYRVFRRYVLMYCGVCALLCWRMSAVGNGTHNAGVGGSSPPPAIFEVVEAVGIGWQFAVGNQPWSCIVGNKR